MIKQHSQAETILNFATKAITACEALSEEWIKNIGPPRPEKMHPFGDVIRGMNSQLNVARRLAERAQDMLKPTDELAVRGILTTCLQACQIAYSFHDEQLSSYIQVFGKPTNEEDLHRLAHSTKSALDSAQARLKNFVVNPASDYALATFGQHIKEQVEDVAKPPKRAKKPKRTSSRRAKRVLNKTAE